MSDDRLIQKAIQELGLEDLWTSDNKIDDIKFCKLLAHLNGTTEKEEMIELLTSMGIKFEDVEKK